MENAKRIRTALYGDQQVSAAELEVLHTPAMQRLYSLHQLGFADRVFIDASHSRIQHVVGALQQVEKLVDAICASLGRAPQAPLQYGAADSQTPITSAALSAHVASRRQVIRLVALLHDLTHAPYGHTLEDEIKLVDSSHDNPDRQADAFYRLLCQLVAWLGYELGRTDLERWPPHLKESLSDAGLLSAVRGADQPDAQAVGRFAHELLCSSVEQQLASWRLSSDKEAARMLAQLNCAMTALLHLEALHKPRLESADLPNSSEYSFQALVRVALSGTPHDAMLKEYSFLPQRDAFMLDIVGNTVCADLLDYAKRDSYFAGLRLDFDPDRIAENFTIISHHVTAEDEEQSSTEGAGPRIPNGSRDPFEGWCLRAAITLWSHKFRADVPSELMNLLNVRYYLYERAIFHPTKCAAGAMLGTALQLMGWGERGDPAPARRLPAHLRFAGDEVFMHDLRASLALALSMLDATSARAVERPADTVDALNGVHSGLTLELIGLRIGQPVEQARADLSAAKLLLDRLVSRRFFRPVWRALPDSTEPNLGLGAGALAKRFLQPGVRYAAEREIERVAGLPHGTVVIHCPPRKTARKIANVLLTMPSGQPCLAVAKLRDIERLDAEIFKDHQKAVRAVEEMYSSMWRMNVYLAPEHLLRHERVAQIAGAVIFQKMDRHGRFSNDASKEWPCDELLATELRAKIDGAASRPNPSPERATPAAAQAPVNALRRTAARGAAAAPPEGGRVVRQELDRVLAALGNRRLNSDRDRGKVSFYDWLAQARPGDLRLAARVYDEWEERFLAAVNERTATDLDSNMDIRTQPGDWENLYRKATTVSADDASPGLFEEL